MFAHAYFPRAFYAPTYYPPAVGAPPVVEERPEGGRRVLARKERDRNVEDIPLPPLVAAVATEDIADAFKRLAPEARARIEVGLGGDDVVLDTPGDDRELQWAALEHRLKLLLDDELLLLAIRI